MNEEDELRELERKAQETRNKIEALRSELATKVETYIKEVREVLKQEGMTLRTVWWDEYGGCQCVTLTDMDSIEVVSKK